MRIALVVLAVTASCGDHNTAVDAPGADVLFTGELVDWDSTDTGFFCGIFGAHLQVHGDPTRTNTTNPNGRFMVMIAAAATTQIDVTPPTAASQCTAPPSTYNVPGILVANKAVIDSGAIISARSFDVDRAPMFGYDAAKAQVLVHVDGMRRAPSITGTHDATQAFDGTAWAMGTSGVNVYFPNVDPTGGTTTISVQGGAVGTGPVPIAAGTFTYVTVVAN